MPAERISKVLAAAGIASRRGADELVAAGRVRVDGRPAVARRARRPGDPGRSRSTGTPIAAATGRADLPRAPQARRRDVDRPRPARGDDRRRPRPAGARPRRPAVPGRAPRPGLRGADPAHQRRRLGRARAPPALRRRARVRRRRSRGCSTATRPRRSRAAWSSRRGSRRSPACAARRGPRTGGWTTCSSRRPIPALVWVRCTIHQGWKRQLRRMFAGVGAPVRRLVRVRIGTLRLDDLAAGDVRVLTTAEVRRAGPSPRRPLIAAAVADRYPQRMPSRSRRVHCDGSSSPSTGRRRAGRARSAPPRPSSCSCGSSTPGLFYRALTALALLRGGRARRPGGARGARRPRVARRRRRRDG